MSFPECYQADRELNVDLKTYPMILNNVNDANDSNGANDANDANDANNASDVSDVNVINDDGDDDDRYYDEMTPADTDSLDRKRRGKTGSRFGVENGAVDPELRPDVYFRPIQSPRREEEEEEDDSSQKPKSGSLLDVATRKILSRSSSYYE